MILKEALRQASKTLAGQSIDAPHLEAEVLLRHVLGWERAQLYARFERELSPGEEEAFWRLVKRRLSREPVAYIVGQREFFGIDLYVDRRVLIPRPESELLVEKALEFARGLLRRSLSSPLLADIGTGSGAIAISLALNLPQARVYAVDLSAAALEVARINCDKHRVSDRVCLLEGDLLHPLPEPVDLIVANLPYIRDSELSWLSPEVSLFEPRSALAGGPDGLDKVRQLLAQSEEKLRPQGWLLLEIGQGQGEMALDLARRHFPQAQAELVPDLSGIDRVVSIVF